MIHREGRFRNPKPGASKIGITIPSSSSFTAYAMIVDINKFTIMVADADGGIAQDTRDNLAGAVQAVEAAGGEVVGFMGDAFLAFLDSAEAVFAACCGIAQDVDKTREWISQCQDTNPGSWEHMKGGPGLKVSVELGRIDVSEIWSKFLGQQRLFIGLPINYAARIGSYGTGCRCLVGPTAASEIKKMYELTGPFHVEGKKGESPYTCYRLDLSDIWKEGDIEPGDDTYWG